MKNSPPVIYEGKIISSDSSLASKKADGVEACKLDYQPDSFYSDEKREVKADGFGRKFARVLDNGELLIYDRETFKAQNQ